MKMAGKLLMAGVIALFAISIVNSNVYAITLGTNITIYDGSKGSSTNTHYNEWWNTENEDQEVEPGCVADQSWDLEGFFLNGNELQVVGGFDFLNGNDNGKYQIGDIFLDTDGSYNPLAEQVNDKDKEYVNVSSNFGYEYVLDLDVGGGTYEVYSLSSDDVMTTVYYKQNENSNPLSYVSGGELVKSGTLTYESGLLDSEVGLLGGTHYALSGFDLSFIAGKEFTAHLTMGCGNDNLMGHGTAPVPEPATIVLMGLGLIGIAGVGRKHLKK